jgi:hypothetical protein
MGTVCDSATSNTPFYARHVPHALVYGHSVLRQLIGIQGDDVSDSRTLRWV